MTNQPENLRARLEQARAGLWYYEGQPEQHCELVRWMGEDVTMRPIDGSPEFVCNGSFVHPVHTKEHS